MEQRNYKLFGFNQFILLLVLYGILQSGYGTCPLSSKG